MGTGPLAGISLRSAVRLATAHDADLSARGAPETSVFVTPTAPLLFEAIAKPRRCGHAGRVTLPVLPDMVGTLVPARPRWQGFAIAFNTKPDSVKVA